DPLTSPAPDAVLASGKSGIGLDDHLQALVRQVVSSVLWEDDCRAAAASGVTRFLECGPGGVLAGMMKRTAPEAAVTSLSELADLPA
ncbi:MAG: [acyl-carrier-protein] S-malonyltransferase, partial [Verrucomicrobiota bacterium]